MPPVTIVSDHVGAYSPSFFLKSSLFRHPCDSLQEPAFEGGPAGPHRPTFSGTLSYLCYHPPAGLTLCLSVQQLF